MSKTKYIDANELRAMMYHGAFEEDSGMQRWDSGCWIRYKMFENALEQIGAADVVEVCRCGECENWKEDFPYNTCALYGGRWNENMFCSYGRRKDG